MSQAQGDVKVAEGGESAQAGAELVAQLERILAPRPRARMWERVTSNWRRSPFKHVYAAWMVNMVGFSTVSLNPIAGLAYGAFLGTCAWAAHKTRRRDGYTLKFNFGRSISRQVTVTPVDRFTKATSFLSACGLAALACVKAGTRSIKAAGALALGSAVSYGLYRVFRRRKRDVNVDDMVQAQLDRNDNWEAMDDGALEEVQAALPRPGKFIKKVIAKVKARIDCRVRTRAQKLVARDLARRFMEEHKMRPTHIAACLPIVVAYVFIPSAAELVAGMVSRSHESVERVVALQRLDPLLNQQ